MLDRRNRARRVVCDAIAVGILAAVLFAAIEAVWLGTAVGADFGRAGGLWELILPLAGMALLMGTVVGLAQGIVLAVVRALADRMARRRTRVPRWFAALTTLAAVPLVAALAAAAFPRDRLAGLGLGLGVLAATYLVARLSLPLVGWIRRPQRYGESGTALRGVLVGLLLLALAVGIYAVDLFVFRHWVVELAAFVFLELFVAAVAVGLHAGERRWGALAAPRVVMALALVAITVGALSIAHLKASSGAALRQVADRHGAVSAHLFDMAR